MTQLDQNDLCCLRNMISKVLNCFCLPLKSMLLPISGSVKLPTFMFEHWSGQAFIPIIFTSNTCSLESTVVHKICPSTGLVPETGPG